MKTRTLLLTTLMLTVAFTTKLWAYDFIVYSDDNRLFCKIHNETAKLVYICNELGDDTEYYNENSKPTEHLVIPATVTHPLTK